MQLLACLAQTAGAVPVLQPMAPHLQHEQVMPEKMYL